MSLWPVVAVECTICGTRRYAADYDMDVAHSREQQRGFAKRLHEEGWDTWDMDEVEADDDGLWWRACRKCRERPAGPVR